MLLEPNGKASTTKKIFSRETGVSIDINSTASRIWDLLTKASEYPHWNSQIISIEGQMAAGEKIILKSTLDPKRSFHLKIKEIDTNKRLVWGDAMGNRTFSIISKENSATFSMVEKIGGPFFPLFSRLIPSFDASFEQFASDLKKAAERKL